MLHLRLGPRARSLAVTAVAILASALALTVGSTGGAAADAPAGAGPLGITVPSVLTAGYAIPQPDCGHPAPGHVACLAFRLRWVAKGTPGARAVRVPAASRGRTGGLTPSALAAAYGYSPSSGVGASQTVALVDAYNDPKALSELDAFDRYYGLRQETGTSFRKVDQQGKTSPLPATDDGWSGEIALDIEAVRGVCNKCHILLVEADSTADSALAAAVDTAARLGATEISNSYGGPESVDGQSTSSKATLAAYNHPKVVITASTGDHGWDDWDFSNDTSPAGWSDNAPDAPASYPTVVAVGGTKLNLSSSGARASESVWDDDGADDSRGLTGSATSGPTWWGDQGASGGGCSTLYQAQSFQASVAGYPCAKGLRSTGDIAADADPATGFDVYDSVYSASHPWVTVGGTSLASPLIAAMWALAGGSGGIAYPAQNLYQHVTAAPSTLYDVTSGGNSFCGGDTQANCSARLTDELPGSGGNPNSIVNHNSYYTGGWAGLLDCGFPSASSLAVDPAACNARAGFDGPSGVGTPHGLDAFKRVGPTLTMSWPALIKRNVTASFRAAFSDSLPGARAATYTWSWGDGTTTTTSTPTTSHRFARPGRFTISVRVKDSTGRTSPAVTKKYVVGYRPTVTVTGPTSVSKDHNRRYTAKVADPDTGGRIVSYTWRSGSTVIGRSASVSHRFTVAGTAKVTLTVVDNSGLSATSKALTVRVG